MGTNYEFTTTAGGTEVVGPGSVVGEDTIDGYAAVFGELDALALVVEGSLDDLERWAAGLLDDIRAVRRPVEYRKLDDDGRLTARSQAMTKAQQARSDVAELFVTEAAILTVRAFPGAAKLIYDVDTGSDGVTAATVIAIYDTRGVGLWDSWSGDEWDKDSAVCDALAAAADWDPEYNGTGVELDLI